MSKAFLLITVILMDLLVGMEFDLFVPSFPELQTHFAVTTFWIEGLLSINFLGFCFSLFFVGALADRHGRKIILLLGLSIFVCASILCLWTPSFYGLLMGRFFQGVGVAAPSILSFLIIADSYPLKDQQRFMALLNGVMNISVALAPLLGSYIALYFHWQGNFAVLLLLGLFVLLMTYVFIPNYPIALKKKTALIEGYAEILSDKSLMLIIGHFVLMVVPYWIFVGMSPLLYIKTLGVSLSHFGYYQGSLAFFFALGCFLFSGLLNKATEKRWLIVSAYIFTFSVICIGLTTAMNVANPLLITLAIMPLVIGQIIPSTILYPLGLQYKPEAKGQISAMIQGGKLILCAITLQLAGFYYQESFQNIGIIMLIVIILTLITLWMIIRGWDRYKSVMHRSSD